MRHLLLLTGIVWTLLGTTCQAGDTQSLLKCTDKQGRITFATTCAPSQHSQAVTTTKGNFYDHTDSQRAYDNTPKWSPPPRPQVRYEDTEVKPATTPAPGPNHSGCGSVILRNSPGYHCAR